MDWKRLHDDVQILHEETNKLADEIHTIVAKMPGRGVYVSESPLVISRLTEIENKLRQIGADKDNLIPFRAR